VKILVANLGSTSFKYRLFDMTDERQLARGGVERIGSDQSECFVEIQGQRTELTTHAPDHAAAVKLCLEQLTHPQSGCLENAAEVSAIGFKAVHGGRVSGVQLVTPDVLSAMEEMSLVAPAHNPPYIAAMRLLGEKLPDIPLVAAFETGFHATIPEERKRYATPAGWAENLHVKKWGFHGASHRYIAQRTAEMSNRDDLRLVSCHLGGSSSLTAIDSGQSVGTTMGMSPQTGLPQNNRVGDFDPFCLPMIMQATGKTLDETLTALASEGGLLGLSGGLSGDMRDLEAAAAEGNEAALLALNTYAAEIRRYLGGLIIELGRWDWLVFTGGIGENGAEIRRRICRNLHEFGVVLDEALNETPGAGEVKISAEDSRIEIWIVPTNEEIVVARQTKACLES